MRPQVPSPYPRETELEKTRTQPVHRRRLDRCLTLFVEFTVAYNVSLDCFEEKPSFAAAVAALFVQHCYDTGVPFWMAKYGLLGIQTRWRLLRGKLGRGWDALRGWSLRRPQRSRLPLPLPLLRAMVGVAFTLGRRGGPA
jgi:hypothetical protein